jgi:hypothetical protein
MFQRASHVTGRVGNLGGSHGVPGGHDRRRDRRLRPSRWALLRGSRGRPLDGSRRGRPKRHHADEACRGNRCADEEELRQRSRMTGVFCGRRNERLPAPQAADAVLADQRAARGACNRLES